MTKEYQYQQDEYHAIKTFAAKLERAATHWKGRWKSEANVRVMDDFIHVARSMVMCLENNQKFTPGIMVQMELPNFEDDDSGYAEDIPFPF